MKKMLRKTVAVALIACMCLAVVPMFASAAYDLTANFEKSGTSATVSGTADAGKEVAIVIVPYSETDGAVADLDLSAEKDSAVYINQVTADDNGNYSFSVQGLDGDNYVAFVGGTEANALVKVAAKAGDTPTPPEIKYADLDADGSIESNDLATLVSYSVELVTLQPAQLLAADLDGNEKIQSNDISMLASQQVGLITDKQFGKDGNSEFVPAGSVVRNAEGTVIAEYDAL